MLTRHLIFLQFTNERIWIVCASVLGHLALHVYSCQSPSAVKVLKHWPASWDGPTAATLIWDAGLDGFVPRSYASSPVHGQTMGHSARDQFQGCSFDTHTHTQTQTHRHTFTHRDIHTHTHTPQLGRRATLPAAPHSSRRQE